MKSDNIKPDCTFEKDEFPKEQFDYMLANPPFGVEWKQQLKAIESDIKGLESEIMVLLAEVTGSTEVGR